MLVDTTVLFLLVSQVGVSPEIAKLGAIETAIFVSFVINERYTYAPTNRTLRSVGVRYLKSNVVRAGGATVALLTLYGLTTFWNVYFVLANLIGIGLGFFVNYVCETVVTWKVQSYDGNQ